MKLENQVCNLELSKELKELGVKQDSLWRWWYDFNLDKFILRHYKIIKQKDLLEMYSAFTVAELINMLTSIRKTDILIPKDCSNVADFLAQEVISEKKAEKRN